MKFSLSALTALFCLAVLPAARGINVYYANTITSGNYSDAGSDLGNVGYWFAVFNRDAGANNLPAADSAANALPAYVSQTFGPTVDGSGGWGGYYDITLPNGTLGNSGALEMNNPPSGPAGTRAEYMTLTFGAGAPSKLRIGVVTDNGDGLQWSNSAIFVNDATTGTITTNNLVPDVHFFDLLNISPGDSIRIDGVSVSATVSHLGGVLLDTVTSLDLEVNTNTGQVTMLAPLADLDIQGYAILSPSGSLNPGGWSSLEAKAGFGNGNASDGIGWEKLGAGIATRVGEFNLMGSTLFGPSGEGALSLGSLFSPGGTQDLQVQITTTDGTVINGVVNYIDSPGLPGDYNGDNVVDSRDYVVWRNSLGATGMNLPADGTGDGTVDHLDYTFWKQRYGNTASGALVAPAAVPEPSSLVVLGMVAPLAFAVRRRYLQGAVFAVLAVLAVPAMADVHRDRHYRLGDDPAEGAQLNQPVGSGNSEGWTYDSEGMTGNGSLQDLVPAGTGIVYANVSGRPQAAADQSTLGLSFSGQGYLQGTGVGNPGLQPNPSENYSGVTSRGMQAWVNPTDTGTLQYLLYDTEQFGIRINANDTWGMVWGTGAAGNTTGRGYNSNVTVNYGQWSHIHQHSYGNTRGVLYVNGVAVATSLPGEIYQTAVTPGLDLDLVVGGDLNTLNQNLYTGLMDDIEIYVSGTGSAGNFGTFNLAEDNAYIAALGLTQGDLTGDGIVNDADVSVFISNWRAEKLLSGRRTGDLTTRMLGDFDFDGFVGLSDWYILATEHVNGASLNLAELLAGQSVNVPEPATVGLLSVAGLVVFRRRLGRLVRRGFPLAALMVACVAGSQVTRAANLWNVDFQGDATSTFGGQTAVDKNYGPDASGIWNHLKVASLSDDPQMIFSVDPTWDLVDNDGNPSNVKVSLTGSYAGWSGHGGATDFLRGDYIILLKNGILGFPDPHLVMNLSGLTPNQRYGFTVFTGSEGAGRHILTTVDTDGDGSLTDEIGVQVNQATSQNFSFTSSATGTALVTVDAVNTEGNFAGFQLKVGDQFPVLTINRETGQMIVSNNTAQNASVMGYMIESNTAGALLPSQWLSVADNYDADGNDSVDPNFNWMKITQPTDRDNLSEVQEVGGNGATIVDGQSVNLGNAWIRSPLQDVSGEILLSDGTIVPLDVRYTGLAPIVGDLNFDRVVDLSDWALVKAAFNTDITSLSAAEKYSKGDLNLNGFVDLNDLQVFEAAFDAMQGAGAFAAAVGNVAVPEPATWVGMATLLGLAVSVRRGRRMARGVV
jgi:hypothetical protein